MDALTTFGSYILQLTGMLIAGLAALRLFYDVACRRFGTARAAMVDVRVRYTQGLLLAFDVLVASGILTTIRHPSWSDIGKLAAIAALRMVLKKARNIGLEKHSGT